MKKSRIKRDLLFKKGKPTIRPLNDSDIGWLWVAYLQGGFDLDEGLTQEAFQTELAQILGGYDALFVIDDANGSFREGYGPVALVGAGYDGWTLEPHVDFFPWASKRNILRGIVGFLHKARYDRNVGVCIVHSLEDTLQLFHKVKGYGVLWYIGKVPCGDERGDDHLFYLRGRKECQKPLKRSVAA